MERLTSREEVRGALAPVRREARTVALVPTMGALHEGHLSLVRAARERADVTVVSVFVNPTQFGPEEDFEAYPRDLAGDTDLLRAEGVDFLFAPSTAEMYAEDAQVTVDPGRLGTVFEGAVRPGHFTGVATVCVKLFSIVGPDLAFFGEKDYQQLKVIERVVRDLDLPVRIVPGDTVREADGLAMSSRNAYLSPLERQAATVLWRALSEARDQAIAGETSAHKLAAALAERVTAEPLASLDYAAIVDASTLEPLEVLDRTARALMAVHLGSTRLIDNLELRPVRQ